MVGFQRNPNICWKSHRKVRLVGKVFVRPQRNKDKIKTQKNNTESNWEGKVELRRLNDSRRLMDWLHTRSCRGQQDKSKSSQPGTTKNKAVQNSHKEVVNKRQRAVMYQQAV